MEDKVCQLSAAFHPKFRLFWLENYDNAKVVIFKVQKVMEDKVQESLKRESNELCSESGGSTDGEVEEDDFYHAVTQFFWSSRIMLPKNAHLC